MDANPSTTTRESAVALHRGGKIAEAAALYEVLLESDPSDADLWGFLSIAQLRLERTCDALASWRKCLSFGVAAPSKLRNIANFLLAMRQRIGSGAEPVEFLDGLDIPDWPGGLPLDKDNKAIVLALARCLIDFDRQEPAERLLESALAGLPDDPDLLATLTHVMIAGGKAEKALDLLRPLTSGAHRENGMLLIVHGAAATAAKRREEAEIISRRAREAVPVFLSAKKPTQRLLVGVLNRAPRFIGKARTPKDLHFSQGLAVTLLKGMNDVFRLLSVFPPEAGKEALAGLPPPEVIFNNWVAPEILSKAGALEFISDYADGFGVPVINHPRGVYQTTRQRNAERLAGIPDLVVPRVLRIVNEPERRELLPAMIGEELGFPVIIRDPFTQVGGKMVRIGTPDELAAYLSKVEQPQLYAIEYFDNPVAPGVYRKIRAAVIGDELLITNIRFAVQWNVHLVTDAGERRKVMAFDTTGKAAALAHDIRRRPEETLGKPAMAALREVRARTPLDFFGIDFDILPDGRLLFFEANAAMYFGFRTFEELPETIRAQKDAIRRLFETPPASSSRACAGSAPPA
ncbi:MAG: hypothetical protein AB7S92_17635 [Parvibaculaceae bacterium]